MSHPSLHFHVAQFRCAGEKHALVISISIDLEGRKKVFIVEHGIFPLFSRLSVDIPYFMTIIIISK